MAVLAHPDDEAYGLGGTLSKIADQGADVHLVTATRGEAGQIREPDLATPANLPQVRERELRCACEIYGIHPPHLLDYMDGQLTIVHQGQAVAKLVQLMREIRPQILVTFGPDGIYGHYDHIAVHRWATVAYDLAADPDCFPGQIEGVCTPHQASKLYYHVLSADVLAQTEGDRPASVDMDGVPFAFFGWDPRDVTTVIDVREHLEAKLRGIQCHMTQVGRDDRYEGSAEALRENPWFGWERFVLARSTVGWSSDTETDLFDRLS
jgi:LmbE family N-acetylglucosaminyl deacetylase